MTGADMRERGSGQKEELSRGGQGRGAGRGEERLETQAEEADGCTADGIEPEIADFMRGPNFAGEEDAEHDNLRGDRGPEHGGTADLLEEEGDDENAEQGGVEDRGHDVERLDQVLGEADEKREADGERAPDGGEEFCDYDIAMLVMGGLRAEIPPDVHDR